FTVLPDTMDPRSSGIDAEQTTLTPDGRDEVKVTVSLRDRFLNTLSGRPVQLIASRTEDRIIALTAETDADGQQAFLLSTTREGDCSLRALDLISGKLLDAQLTISAGTFDGMGGYSAEDANWYGTSAVRSAPVGQFMGKTLYGQVSGQPAATFDVIDHFRIEIALPGALEPLPAGSSVSVPARQDMTFRIFAEDRTGNTVEDYTGTVYFSSTDAKATIPFGPRQFSLRDLGVKTFTLGLRFDTPGQQTLVAEDSTKTIRGSQTLTVEGDIGSSTERSILITSPAPGSTVGTPTVALKGSGPALINLIATGGKEVARGETDADGFFEIAVALDTTKTEHLLRVEESTGKYRSDDHKLYLDATPPAVTSTVFNPPNPSEDQETTLTIKSEPALSMANLEVDGQKINLLPVATQTGSYAGRFSIAKAGNYQPTITVRDQYGNEAKVMSTLTVGQKRPPNVKNLVAESKAVNTVALKWDPVASEKVDAYRIYVGEDPKSFAYSLDTDQAVSAATVAGLKPAVTYYFAVTALRGGVESAEKSNVASATVIGLNLIVTPGDTILQLDWNPLQKTTPLSAYMLEYGVEPNTLTEKRMLNGELQTYTMRDLINSVTYYLKLTPVTTTGEALRDLSVTGEGTPQGTGYHPSAAEELPFDPSTLPPPNLHEGAPALSHEGLPPIVWWMALAGAAVLYGLHWHRRRTLRMTLEFLQAMERRYKE
ncbi:MAG: fibronectin type III domain-containing protein, partial [Candidatus Peribacteraceae bacterium]|nr:fibronectin type III domain-containing protein [Candidatus Peribacteraceae bacterium]